MSRLSRFRRSLALGLLPFAIGGSFPREVSNWLNALQGICFAIVIILVIIFALWIASMLFGGRGGGRG